MGVKIMTLRKEKNNKMTVKPKVEKREISPWRPYDIWADMDQLFDSFRSNFDDLFWPWREPNMSKTSQKTPLMDVADMGNYYEMRLEIPGISKENVDIQVTQNSVEIKAKCDDAHEEKGKNWLRCECSGVSYYRSIGFPEYLKTDEVDAELKDGILTINLPKLEPKPSHKVKIK